MLAEDGPLHPMHDDIVEDKVYRQVEGPEMCDTMIPVRYKRYKLHHCEFYLSFFSLFPIFRGHFCSSKQRRCADALAPFKVPVAATASEMRRDKISSDTKCNSVAIPSSFLFEILTSCF